MQDHILDRQGDFNTSLDLHEKELVNIACNTFTEKQDEADKELILKNLHFVKNASMQQCRTLVNDWLHKNGVNFHTGIYSISMDRRTCRVTFNSDSSEQNPFEVLDLSIEVPNELYHSIAGPRAKTLNAAGIHTLKK